MMRQPMLEGKGTSQTRRIALELTDMTTARQSGQRPIAFPPYRKPGFRHDGFLVAELVKRDFKARYDRSVLGMFWCVLEPTLTMALLYAVFSFFFKIFKQQHNFKLYAYIYDCHRQQQ